MPKFNTHSRRLVSISGITLLVLMAPACSARSALPATVPAASPVSSTPTMIANPLADTYHGVLMLERSADLILTVIDKIQSNQIRADDIGTIAPYVNPFPWAVDYLSQSTPSGEFDDVWTQITQAVQRFNIARTLVVQYKPVPTVIFESLKDTRKMLDMDQEMLETYLENGGRDEATRGLAECRRFIRSNRRALVRGARAETPGSGVEEKSAQAIESRELWQAVHRLRPSDQRILYLRYFMELSVAETAEALQMAEGTVKSRSARALERLRAIVRNEFPTLGEQRE